MRYGEVITRSLNIFWRHKYLWLLGALGGGESVGGGGGGGNFGGFRSGGASGRANNPDFSGFTRQLGDWVGGHLGLLVTVAAVLIVLALAYFLVSCVASGALIRAAAEHDAERPFGLGPAWQAGLRTFWPILGLRLLFIAYVLAVVIVVGGLFLLAFLAGSGNNPAGAAGFGVLGGLAVLVVIPVSIAAGLVYILGLRAVVLEQSGALAGLGRGWRLLRKRLGRVLLSWLIQIGLSLVGGIIIGIALVVLLLPGAAIVFAAYAAGGLGAALSVGIIAGLIYLVLVVALSGAAGSFIATYWTLAFRRLDLDSVAAG